MLREKWPLLAKTDLCKSTRACFNVKKKKMLFLHELYRRIYSDAEGVEQHEKKKVNRKTRERRHSQRTNNERKSY